MGKRKDDKNLEFNSVDDVNTLINRIVKEMMAANTSLQGDFQSRPGVYGFNIRVDGNGISIVERDEKNVQLNSPLNENREPLLDLMDREDSITVIAELPGVEKASIRLAFESGKLTISAAGTTRHYNKELQLTQEIDPVGSSATYQNGVLEISLKKGYYKGNDNQIKVN